MVIAGMENCPKCDDNLLYFDSTKRMVKYKNAMKKFVLIRRLRCGRCGSIHRELPDHILPFKHYDADIIQGVVEGLITSDTLGYEDYPCEATMSRWIQGSQNLQVV